MHPDIEAVLSGKKQWCVVQGDNLDILPTIPECSIDLVWTDPPFGHRNNDGDLIQNIEQAFPGRRAKVSRKGKYITATYNAERETKARAISNDGTEAHDLFKKVIKLVNNIIMPGSCLCSCCGGGGSHIRKESPIEPSYAWWSIWMAKVFHFKQMIVWDKGPMGIGHHYRRSYEVVLVASKKGAKCRWYTESREIENILRPGDYGIRKIIPSKREHPTAKPFELPMFFIGLHTLPGHVVLDPFCGGGSTGEAALRSGRRFIGIELDPVFVEMSRKLLEKTKRLHSAKRATLHPETAYPLMRRKTKHPPKSVVVTEYRKEKGDTDRGWDMGKKDKTKKED